jgi:hypothetical protein
MKILLVASILICSFMVEVHACNDKPSAETASARDTEKSNGKSADRELAVAATDAPNAGTTQIEVRRERRPSGKMNY